MSNIDIKYFTENRVVPSYICDSKLINLHMINKYEVRTVLKSYRSLRLLAVDIYGSEDYSWLLGYVNGITDDDVVTGITIKCPDPSMLDVIRNI